MERLSDGDLDDANRMVFWEDIGSFLNFSFLSSFLAFFSLDSVSRQVVRLWMLPARELRVESVGPVTDVVDVGVVVEGRMNLSWRSSRYCFIGPKW